MRTITAILLLGALGWASPAAADVWQARQVVRGTDTSAAKPFEMSSRHRHWRQGRIVAIARACPGFTVAPTLEKTYHDRRWPYVSWRGSCDSLYAPGPLVTFVRYGY